MWNINYVIVILYNVVLKKNFLNDFYIEIKYIYVYVFCFCDNIECSVSNNWMLVNRLRFNYSFRFLFYY